MRKRLFWIIGLLAVAIATVAFVFRGRGDSDEIEYRYAKVEIGTIIRSIEATGQLVAKTTVDVKSKAGGKIVRLAVDEGSVVKKGDLIAVIDPSDTQATYEQALADVTTSQARAAQARTNYELQVANSRTAVEDAKRALAQARIRLERAKLNTERQPALSTANVRSAEAAFRAAEASVRRLESVTIPQMRRDADAGLNRARAERDSAEAEMKRQEELLQKGYVAQAAVERARSAMESARASFAMAEQKKATIENDIEVLRSTEKTDVERARATLEQARANTSDIGVAKTNLAEAEEAVRAAQLNVEKAVDAQMQNDIRRQDMLAASASTVRSKVSLDNARVQLDSTTVVAPRDGVVTMKYLEEGTIIPPGTSTFSQGTSLVQISDTTEMYVECAVDEADIGNVKTGQRVRVTTEAFPGETVRGEVERINPAARTEQNVTAIKVRVRIMPGFELDLKPGMNATAEFIVMRRPDVLVLPSQAIQRGRDGATVRVKTKDPKKPEVRKVEIGESGNEGVEVTSGLKEGDEVVIAELNVAELREIQKRMQEAQEGGGLAGGRPTMGGRGTLGGGGGGGRGGAGQGGRGGGAGGGGQGARGGGGR